MEASGTGNVLAVYLTFPDQETAERIAGELVEQRLVACVNLLPAGTSFYRWEGELVREAEVVGWAKSTRARLPEVEEAVRRLHPYDVPCVVAYPAAGGLAEYLGWVEEETA